MIKKTTTRPNLPIVNYNYLKQESWNILQIIHEFLNGYEQLSGIKPAISVFGSARLSKNHKYCRLATKIATSLSNSGFCIVTGGGGGIMEAANFGAYQGKSLSVGLNILLKKPEPSNNYQDISIKFKHFFSRKVMFSKYASAFIVFPGGFGTLNELIEILVLVQNKVIKKVPIILVDKNYWQGLINWFTSKLLLEKMIDPQDIKLFKLVNTATEILKYVK